MTWREIDREITRELKWFLTTWGVVTIAVMALRAIGQASVLPYIGNGLDERRTKTLDEAADILEGLK